MPVPLAAPAAAGASKLLPFIPAIADIAGNLFGQNRQRKENARVAARQHGYNMELLKYQLDYNSPASQMQRFADAGLNPHLIYGQASSGNMQQQTYPSIQPTDMSIPIPNMLQLAQQAEQLSLMKTQADLNRVRAGEGTAKTDLINAQKELIKSNPYLDEGYLKSLVSQMESKAKLMKTEANYWTGLESYLKKGQGIDAEVIIHPRMFEKFDREMNMLQQKYNLATSDQQVKAEIIKSKQFQNDLDKVWNEFLKQPNLDGETINRILIMMITKLFK